MTQNYSSTHGTYMNQRTSHLFISLLATTLALAGCGGGGGGSDSASATGGSQGSAVAASEALQGVWSWKCTGAPVYMINGVYPDNGQEKIESLRGDAYLTITGSDDHLKVSTTYHVYDVKDTGCTGKPVLKLDIGGSPLGSSSGLAGSPEQGFISINRGPELMDRIGTAVVTSTFNQFIGEKGVAVTEYRSSVPPLFALEEGNYPIVDGVPIRPYYKWGSFLFPTSPSVSLPSVVVAAVGRFEERNDNYVVVNPGATFDFATLVGSSAYGTHTEADAREWAKNNFASAYTPGMGFKRINAIPDYELLLRSK